MTKRFVRFGCIIASIFWTSCPDTMALAGDEGLYPPPPPTGAASVRVVDIRSVPRKDIVTVGGKSMTTTASPGKFVYLQQGTISLASPNFDTKTAIEAGQYYSIFVGNNVSVVYREPRPPLTQSLVVLYNLSSLPDVSLRTDDGAMTVVSSLKPFRVGQQAVNPLKVGFAVYAGNRKVGFVPAAQLKRGTSFGIFVMNAAGSSRVVAAPGPALSD